MHGGWKTIDWVEEAAPRVKGILIEIEELVKEELRIKKLSRCLMETAFTGNSLRRGNT